MSSENITTRLSKSAGFFKGGKYGVGAHALLSVAARPVSDLISVAKYGWYKWKWNVSDFSIAPQMKSLAASTLTSSLFIVPAVVGRKILTGEIDAPDAVKEFLSHFNFTEKYTGPLGTDRDAGLITYAILATILGAFACYWAAETAQKTKLFSTGEAEAPVSTSEAEAPDSNTGATGPSVSDGDEANDLHAPAIIIDRFRGDIIDREEGEGDNNSRTSSQGEGNLTPSASFGSVV